MSFTNTSFMAAADEAGLWARLKSHTGALRIVFGTMFRADPIRSVALMVLRPANAAGAIIAALWLKYIIQQVAMTRSGSVVLGAAGLGLTFALVLLCSWLAVIIEARLQERTAHEFDHRVARTVGAESSLDLLDSPAYRDRLELLKDDSASLPTTVTSVVDMLSATVAAGIALAVLVSVTPVLLVLVLAAVPSLLVGKRAEAARQQVLLATAEPTRAGSDLFDLATSVQAAREVRTLGLRSELMAQYEQVSADVVVARRRAWNMWAAWRSLSWAIFIVAFAGCLVYVVLQADAGRISTGDVVLVVIVGAQVNMTVAALAYAVTFALGSIHAVDRLRWIEQATAARRRGGRDAYLRQKISAQARGIELRDVKFSYADGTTAVDGITFSIAPGTVTAIVGENGAGKTTLIKLLARLYEPGEGEIIFDGVSHRDMGAAEWRRRVSGILQDYARFELRAGHAVGVGDLEWMNEESSVRAAMERAGSADLIGQFPRAADTPLGASYADGYEPSGGQWQSLALGRAMMRQAPRLLLLDEPMSALDPIAEERLLLSYATVCREQVRAIGAMAVITSHRLPAVGFADQIVVLDRGRVIEIGDHSQLLAAGGRYADFYETQARAFHERPRLVPVLPSPGPVQERSVE